MNTLVLPIVGMLIPIVLVPIILGLKHARLERELEHRERMRALELGRTLPQDEPWSSPARTIAMIGAGVPVGVFFIAWIASRGPEFHPEVWVAAGFVGVASVVCGSTLAGLHLVYRARDRAFTAGGQDKPVMDADAYDFAGSRG